MCGKELELADLTELLDIDVVELSDEFLYDF